MGSHGWTAADVRAHTLRHSSAVPANAPPARAKHGNQKITIDNILFDSKKEGAHYLHLKMRLRLGEITDLELQPVFDIYVERQGVRIHCGDYTADFRYWERLSPDNNVLRVDDVKSPSSKTEAYQLRKRLVEAIYGITITEV